MFGGSLTDDGKCATLSGRGRGRADIPAGYHYVEVRRFGKGEEEQKRADARIRAHRAWVNAQLNQAQDRRDRAHKREVRAFYANKRKKAKESK